MLIHPGSDVAGPAGAHREQLPNIRGPTIPLDDFRE